MKKQWLVVLYLLILSAPWTGVTAGSYQIRDLGTVSGGHPPYVVDVNEKGEAVGFYWDASYRQRAFMLTTAGVQIDFGAALGLDRTVASAINNVGQVLFTVPYSFVWTPEGTKQLSPLPGDSGYSFCSLNDAGQIVGTSYGPLQESHAVMWQPDGTEVPLAPLVPNGQSAGTGINSRGETVGSAADSLGVYRAVRWSQSGGVMELGLIPGQRSSSAVSSNESGQVVGDWYTGSTDTHAVLWNSSNAPLPLPELPGGSLSAAVEISNSGQVIGWSDAADGIRHAVVWESDGAITILGTLPGGTNTRAVSLTDAGLIFGSSDDSAGNTHLVVWEPVPEPSSLSILGCSLVGLGSFGVRRGSRLLGLRRTQGR